MLIEYTHEKRKINVKLLKMLKWYCDRAKLRLARSNESKCQIIVDFKKWKFERFNRDWVFKLKSRNVKVFQTFHANN